MDLRTIKTFKTIVKFGSFQKAADELMYAQSTVTTHMKNLESSLGVQLLERGKQTQLTEAGRLLYEKADFLLKGFENLEMEMADFIQGESGILRIGVMEPAASYRFPPLLTPFQKKFPKVHLSIQIHSSLQISEMLARNELDLALCAAPAGLPWTDFEALFIEDMGLLVPEAHPFAAKNHIELKDLECEELLATSSSCPFRNHLENCMAAAAITPSYRLEVSNMLAMKHYVGAGYGIAVVPLITVDPPPEGTVVLPIADFPKGLTIGILTANQPLAASGSINSFVSLFRSQFSAPLST